LVITPLKAVIYDKVSEDLNMPVQKSISYEDFVVLFELDKIDPDDVAQEMDGLFFWITVEGDVVTEVAQISWC